MIQNLQLQNFRNCQRASYTLGDGLIFITGNNGAGKTTILEALGLISFLKSFRLAHDREMLHFGASFYRIEAEYQDGNETHKIAIAYGRNTLDEKAPAQKKYTFDDHPNEKAANIIGRVPSVVLSPDDMRIVAGDHTDRRRFLDLLLSMLYPAYFMALQHYHRTLKLRSQTLKTKPDEALLTAIDRELALAGVALLGKRRQFIPEFGTPFGESVKKISGGRDVWRIVYKGDTGKVQTIDDYLQMLKEHRANDLRLKQTTSGIHRDRIYFLQEADFSKGEGFTAADFTEREIRAIGSQGQKRTAALALKAAQFTYMREKLGKTPILLIDDILNELDLSRRAQFIEFLGETKIGQVFFTTTDLVGMQDFLKSLQGTTPIQQIEL